MKWYIASAAVSRLIGGSTPKALAQSGIGDGEFSTDDEMFDLVHEMRTRIVTSPSFAGDRIIGAILFEGTMDRQIEGLPSPGYLWGVKQVVPFVKVDKGLADPSNGVQLMKPMGDLDALLKRAASLDVFATKMRSVITVDHPRGIDAVVTQQFEVGRQILAAGLVPILEPEVDIASPDKEAAEQRLRERLLAGLEGLDDDQQVMLKLTIPSIDGFYSELIDHPSVLRVVALSGGYAREDANDRLSRNPGLIASFSRALVQDLSAQQSDEEFDAELAAAIDSIYQASIA
jgi:fructose-bisphosphate aldolase class I